ncbi:MAG: hypothetical protein NDJ89_03885 [Oligoflexia bacterium]|nr:hypothetical protein [Oligoflexia bacterium]
MAFEALLALALIFSPGTSASSFASPDSRCLSEQRAIVPVPVGVQEDLRGISNALFRSGRRVGGMDGFFLFEADESRDGVRAVARPYADVSAETREELRSIYSLYLEASEGGPWTAARIAAAGLTPRGRLLLLAMLSELRGPDLPQRVGSLGFKILAQGEPILFRDPGTGRIHALIGHAVVGTPAQDPAEARRIAAAIEGREDPRAASSIFNIRPSAWVYSRITPSVRSELLPADTLEVLSRRDGFRNVSRHAEGLSAWHAELPAIRRAAEGAAPVRESIDVLSEGGPASPARAIEAYQERRERERPKPLEEVVDRVADRFSAEFFERVADPEVGARMLGRNEGERGVRAEARAGVSQGMVQGAYRVLDAEDRGRFEIRAGIDPLRRDTELQVCLNEPGERVDLFRYCIERKKLEGDSYRQAVRFESVRKGSDFNTNIEFALKAEVGYVETRGEALSLGEAERNDTRFSAHVSGSGARLGLPAGTRVFAGTEIMLPERGGSSRGVREDGVGARHCVRKRGCLELSLRKVSEEGTGSEQEVSDRALKILFTHSW